MNIAEILRAQATTRPNAAAIIDTRHGRSRTLTFAELELAASQGAALLHQAGLRPGDAVLVFYPMSAELYIALSAILRLGLVAMFLDPAAGKEHIENCCALNAPRALIAGPRAHLLRLVSPALRRIPYKFSIGLPVPVAVSWSRAAGLKPLDCIQPCEPQTPALLTFTSGSTGRPKAAVRTHGFLLAQHRILSRTLELAPGETDLSTLPIFVLANLASGVTSLIPNADLRRPGSIHAAPVIAQIQAHRPARTAASPALLERLAEHCERHGQTLTSFKKIHSGGAPIFPQLLERSQRIAPNAEVIAVYGSTEAEPIAHVASDEIDAADVAAMLRGRGLLAGSPVADISVRILKDQWGEPVGPYTQTNFDAVCLPAGEAGEIVVSGEHVLTGYLHGKGDDETKFVVESTTVDGTAVNGTAISRTTWHRTGDAGYLDSRGRLWLLGRCSARVSDERGTLYPFAVECAAHHHPGVRRAAFVSHGNRRVLAIELRHGTSKSDLVSLKESLKESLAWAHIDEVRLLKRIPVDRRHNAKIDYPALYRVLEKGFEL